MTLITVPSSLSNFLNKQVVQIPKIIHQTYISLEKLPKVWKDTPVTWQKYHPDWKYKFWSDDDCKQMVSQHFPEFLETYNSYKHNIQRADAIRPMVLYLYGGLYVDCDIQPIRSVEDLFYQDNEVYLVRSSNGNVVTNCFMASKPKVKFWKLIIDEMYNRAKSPNIFWSLSKHIEVMYTTGPMFIDKMFNQYKNTFKFYFLPREYIIPTKCGLCAEKPCISLFGYTKILEGSSWVNIDTRVLNFLACNYPNILVCLALGFLIYNLYKYIKL